MPRVGGLLAAGCVALVLVSGAHARVAITACGAETDQATDVTSTSATLHGTLGALSGSDASGCGTWFFDYGMTNAYGSTTPVQYADEGEQEVSATITGLTPNTTYHFRVHATAGLANLGGDVTFTTLPATTCGAVSGSATNVTGTGATLTGTLGSGAGADAAACGSWRFEYGTTSGYGSTTASSPAGTGQAVPVSSAITGLAPDTTYHFRLSATSGASNLGSDVTFTTPAEQQQQQQPVAIQTTLVRVQSSVSPPAAAAGANVTFTITVRNEGFADAPGVTLSDSLPAALGLVSASSSQGACAPGPPVLCTLGTLAAGQTVTVTVAATGLSAGSLTNTATASGNNFDPADSANTTSSATVSITPAPQPPPAQPPTQNKTKKKKPTPQYGPVVLDRAIGGVSIGMSRAGVDALFGEPLSTLRISLGGGATGVLARYRAHGAPLLVTFDADAHVVSIEAYSSYFRTAGGIGPQTPLDALKALRGFRRDYCESGYWNGSGGTGPGEVVTVFTPDAGDVASVLITELRLYTACAAGAPELPPPAPTRSVVLGRSIGGISIGMSKADVVELLGAPVSTLRLSLGRGRAGLFARYRSHGAPLLVTYDAAGHVASIEAYAPFFHTAGGIGPGTALGRARTLRGFHRDYCQLGYWNGGGTTKPGDVVTVFTPNAGAVASVLITELRLYTTCASGSTELPPAP